MNIPQIYLVEPYNAYAPKGKKKHWMEEVEEQALLAKIIAEQQARQQAELDAIIQEAKSRTLPPQAPPESVPTIVGNTAGAGSEGGAGSAPGGGGMPVWDFWNPAGDTVNFDRTPSTGAGPVTVTFTNLTTTPQFDSYNWYFSDGQSSTAVNPIIVFQTGSTNPTVVTASLQTTNSISGNPGGRSPDVYIIVSYPVVTAGFTFTTSSNIAPFSVSFVNTSTNTSQTPTTTYRWTFTYNDGVSAPVVTTSTLAAAASRRIDSGSFTASLQATGSYGIATTASVMFAAPAPTLTSLFTLTSASITSPSSVTLTPAVTYNGIGTIQGRWNSGEWSEPTSAEDWLAYGGTAWTRTYDTRSAAAVTDGKFTASLSVTESIYGIKSLYTQSFALAFPTLGVTLAAVSSSNYSPSVVTFTPTVTNTGAGTVTGKYFFGEFTEAETEYWVAYSAGPTIRTYDTRSGTDSTGSFTASLQLTGSNYGITAFVTQSIPLLFPSVTSAFTTHSFGFGGAEDSYMEPVSMSYTSSVTYNGTAGTLTYNWDFGSASFWTTVLGAQTGTTSSVGPHFRADYDVGNFTASLQATGSYDVASRSEQLFTVST